MQVRLNELEKRCLKRRTTAKRFSATRYYRVLVGRTKANIWILPDIGDRLPRGRPDHGGNPDPLRLSHRYAIQAHRAEGNQPMTSVSIHTRICACGPPLPAAQGAPTEVVKGRTDVPKDDRQRPYRTYRLRHPRGARRTLPAARKRSNAASTWLKRRGGRKP